jgi:glucose/arabinose dehydrogenase
MTSILLAGLIACGNSNKKTPDAAVQKDAPIDTAPDATSVVTVSLGQGGANALLWDAATSTLYLTDNTADKLESFTGGTTINSVATLPTESAGISLGGMLKLADNSIVIANFGFGTQGTLFQVASGGTTGSSLTGLDATRRRIGLAQDSAGTMYSSYFTGGMGTQVGGVASMTITTGAALETEIAGATTSAGFKKVVGIAATTTAVYVSDQTQKTIFKIDLTSSNAVSALATGLPAADLLMMLPNGDMLTGGGATITRVTQAGTVSAVSLPGTTFSDVRGIAFDPVSSRLFIVDHSATAGVGDTLNIAKFTP